MNTKTKFSEIYSELIAKYGDTLYNLKNNTFKNKITFKQFLLLFIAAHIVFLILCLFNSPTLLSIYVMPTFFALMVAFVYSLPKHSTKYNNTFKTKIIGDMVKYLDKSLTYTPVANLPTHIYYGAGFDKINVLLSEDLVEGNLNDKHHFQMAEIKAMKRYIDVEGETKYDIKFNGIFVKTKITRELDIELYLTNDTDNFSFLDKLNNSFHEEFRIQLDSQEFENLFDVYSPNKILAMQILTADTMQLLVDFHKELQIPYEINITNGHIYIRFSCYNMFEPNTKSESPLDKETLYKYFNVLNFSIELSKKLIEILNSVEI